MYLSTQTRYIITILFQIAYSQATYILSQDETDWQTSNCSMATPEIRYGSSPGQYWIKNNTLLTPEMSSVWIGYYQVLVGFEYIVLAIMRCSVTFKTQVPSSKEKDTIRDCVKEENLTAIAQYSINGDPGECFLGCSDASIVGVSDTTCFCLNENYDNIHRDKRSKVGCTNKCSSLLRVACGGGRSHLSVYRVISNATKQETNVASTSSARPKICLTYNPHPGNFIWDDCNLSHSIKCLYGGGITDTHQFASWIETSIKCFDTARPIPYWENLSWRNDKTTDVAPYWTGIFKSNATFKIYDTPGWVEFNEDTKYGMLEYNRTGKYHYIHFVKGDATTRKSLCKTDTGGVTTTRHTNSVTESYDDKKSKMIIQTETTVSGANSTQTGTNEPKSNDTWVIGVVVGVCVFVVIVIIVSIIAIKRRGSHCLKKKPSQTGDDKTGSGNGTANDNHAYFAVEPHELEQTGNACHMDYNYVDVEMSNNPRSANAAENKPTKTKSTSKYNTDENTYNTTTEVNEGKDMGGENIYNKLSNNDNTYSTTTHTIPQKGTKQITDDVYNELGGENENTYDSTTSKRPADVPDDIYDETSPEQDDTYSHVQSSNKLQHVRTDNVYGSAT